jgi:DNA-binding MarR family transcriptional regulator
MTSSTQDQEIAIRLAVAIKRLRLRLREVAPASAAALPIAQMAIVHRLRTEGPATAAYLATAEHVSQQAIAQNLSALKQAGLVAAAPDPTDGRKILISVTAAGNRLFEAVIASRNTWLAQAIDAEIAPDERPVLAQAIALLERLSEHSLLAGRSGRSDRADSFARTGIGSTALEDPDERRQPDS